MEVSDLFSRRYGYHRPVTLYCEELPKQVFDGLRNILEQDALRIHLWNCYSYVTLTLAWPRPTFGTPEEYIESIQSRPWHDTLESLELILRRLTTYCLYGESELFRKDVNHLFELLDINWTLDESGGFVKRIENLAVVENALQLKIDKFDPAREHLKNAWEQFNKRPNADYANSIKEAITAVESAAKIATNSDKADLAKALDKLDLHPALREGIKKLYGYTSDEKGIRHGGIECPDVDETEAELMLTICAGAMVFLAKTCVARDERSTAEGAAQ